MDNMDMHASTKALMNPLVLNLVFSYMDAPTLKSARSVCTLWADLGAAFLGEQVTVTFRTEHCCRKKTSKSSKELASLHPKLARSILLIMFPSPCGWVSLPKNLTTNLPQISNHIVILDVMMISKFIPTLEQMWRTHHFPNLGLLTLTVILIKVDHRDTSEDEDDNSGHFIVDEDNHGHFAHSIDQDDEESDDAVEIVVVAPKIPQFLTLPNLRSLKIVVREQNENGQDDGISSICQRLLNSAPNILHVDIDASFYPDFTPCEKLKVLSYTFVQYFDDWAEADEFVDTSELAGMLDTCRNSLSGLSLSCPHDWENFAPGTFVLPSSPTLMVMHIEEMYPLGNFLHRVNLPNLTHVTFSGYNRNCMGLTHIFKNFDLPHERITSLTVEVFYTYVEADVETAAKIVRLFPSVKKFRLKLTICVDNDEDEPNVTEMLQSFATWDLTSGSVEIESDKDTTDVMAVLRGLVVWKALSRTAVNFEATGSPTFVLDDEMEEILLYCRSLRWIKMSGFQMEEEDRDRFEEFIDEHALQISLLNWVN
ncbi:hypothetical protein Fcan01_10222 [Folsomia candida]|uniref:F-box domain-containing protein n=2 Tax=Folsomia candida TaxID=158441 RepID=A0A226ECL1_FOLCA|nr:hypothetical protein Fcan01_10222 [Folsomia candida]